MLKKIVVIALAAVLLGAISVSAYNVMASSRTQSAEAVSSDPLMDPINVAEEVSTASSAPAAGSQAVVWNPGQGGSQGGQGGQGRQGGRSEQAGQGRGNGAGTGTQTGVPAPQNGLTEWITLQGTVSNLAGQFFTLITEDGQSISVQLGSQRYVRDLGLTLVDGEAVSVTGFWETSGSFAAGQITLESNGQTFDFRDDLGRPLWAGGKGGH